MCTLTREELEAAELSRVEEFEASEGIRILECSRHDDLIVPTLINGKEVDREDWLDVVRIGNRSCTGTLVGDRVVISAAHCGRNNSRSNVEIYKRETIPARIVHHPRYNNRSNHDLCVLILDRPVADGSIKFATVGVNHNFQNGQDVDIAGYGCTRQGGGGGNDGILRWGESKVTGFTGTDVVTSWRRGGAALCFGDSGGPMFADGSPSGNRTLIAVNSKGNIRDTNYNMRLDLDTSKEFLTDIANRFDVEIQGITTQPEEPDDPPSPPDDSGLAVLLAKREAEFVMLHEKWQQILMSGAGGNQVGDPIEDRGPTFGL